MDYFKSMWPKEGKTRAGSLGDRVVPWPPSPPFFFPLDSKQLIAEPHSHQDRENVQQQKPKKETFPFCLPCLWHATQPWGRGVEAISFFSFSFWPSSGLEVEIQRRLAGWKHDVSRTSSCWSHCSPSCLRDAPDANHFVWIMLYVSACLSPAYPHGILWGRLLLLLPLARRGSRGSETEWPLGLQPPSRVIRALWDFLPTPLWTHSRWPKLDPANTVVAQKTQSTGYIWLTFLECPL